MYHEVQSKDSFIQMGLADTIVSLRFNPIALRRAKIVYNFGLSECNRVNTVLVCLCNEKSAVRNLEFIDLDFGHVQTVLSWMCIIIKIQ